MDRYFDASNQPLPGPTRLVTISEANEVQYFVGQGSIPVYDGIDPVLFFPIPINTPYPPNNLVLPIDQPPTHTNGSSLARFQTDVTVGLQARGIVSVQRQQIRVHKVESGV